MSAILQEVTDYDLPSFSLVDNSSIADDGAEFLAILSKKIKRQETPISPVNLLRKKQELEAEMIDTIMRRTQQPAADFSRKLNQSFAWLDKTSRSNLINELNATSAKSPQVADEIVQALFNLQVSFSHSISKIANKNSEQIFGVHSQISNLEFTKTPAPLTHTATRTTVKLQLQMQALTQLTGANNTYLEEAMGENRSIIVVQGQAIELSVFLQYFDPIVLDLNGDGLNLKNFNHGVIFDLSGDGAAAQCGFVQDDDALLFLDENNDGVCNNGRELFGDHDGYANGFEKLRAYDLNGDNIINDDDDIYGELRVWNDWNNDGVCDAEEVRGLREVGVKFISLDYQNTRENNNGNLITERGVCGLHNGELRDVVDAKFLSA